jgi:hypothetical protein
MNTNLSPNIARNWTAADLRKADAETRDAALETAATQAEEEYRNDTGLTDFEAFGKDDLHGSSSSSVTEPR